MNGGEGYIHVIEECMLKQLTGCTVDKIEYIFQTALMSIPSTVDNDDFFLYEPYGIVAVSVWLAFYYDV